MVESASMFLSRLQNSDVKTRFVISFLGNLLRVGLMFGVSLFLARKLGPASYGNYNFLLNSFLGLKIFVDLGTNNAFLTFLSERKRSKKFFTQYGWILTAQFSILIGLVLFLPDAWRNKLWLNQDISLIIVACCASFAMNQLWEAGTNLGESLRDTLRVQQRNLFTAFLFLVSLLVLEFYQSLTVANALYSILVCYLLINFLYIVNVIPRAIDPDLDESFREINQRYFTYCHPLAVTCFVSFFLTFWENWMLQFFGGNVEQGYYSIGWKFSTIGLLATTALLKIFWKEIAEAQQQANLERVKAIYFRTCRTLYGSGTILCCFVSVFASEILATFLGHEYLGATLSFSLLLLYPIHQSLGQIVAALLQASGRVKTYRNYSILVMCTSLPISYLMLASKDSFIPGLDMGSQGLAFKMVLVNIASVNLFLWVISKEIGVRLGLLHQVLVFLLFYSFAHSSKYLLTTIFEYSSDFPGLVLLVVSCGLVYLVFTLVMLSFKPQILGLEPTEWKTIQARILRRRD